MNFLSELFQESRADEDSGYNGLEAVPDEGWKYTLPEMLDVGLKIMQLGVKNKVNISCETVDSFEKEERIARLERRQSKEDEKRSRREERKSLRRESSMSDFPLGGAPGLKVEISLSNSIQGRGSNILSSVGGENDYSTVDDKLWGSDTNAAFDWTMAALSSPPMMGMASYQTIMLRNIPNKYTRTQLLKRLNTNFRGEFDFLYVPIDFNNKCNVGYAFINFKKTEYVLRFMEHYHNQKAIHVLPDYNSTKICEVTPAHVQGLELNIEHIRNSPISDQLRSRPDWQPLLFDATGEPMPFPLRTKKKTNGPPSNTSQAGQSVKDSLKSPKSNKKISFPDSPEAAEVGKEMLFFSDKKSERTSEFSDLKVDDDKDESFPKKEKRRKEKNKRLSLSSDKRKLGPCTVDNTIHTTAMVRYLPEEVSRLDLLTRLAELLKKGSYDFLYMPIDFEKNLNVGYFFINFIDSDELMRCVDIFHNKNANEVFLDSPCEDPMEVSPARVQGLETNIQNLKNSSVGAVGQSNLQWKPLLFGEDGSMQEMDLQPKDSKSNKKNSVKDDGTLKMRASTKSTATKGTLDSGMGKSAKSSISMGEKKLSDSPDLGKGTVLNLFSSMVDSSYNPYSNPFAPMNLAAAGAAGQSTDYENFKTVMLRNIPNKYTRKMLQDHLDKVGFKKMYDFLYMPIDFRNKCNVGYAFINFRANEGVKKCFQYFQGVDTTVCLPGFNSSKIVEVMPARVQGLEENVRHLQNSSIIEQLQEKPDKPDWQPLVLDQNNKIIPFPWTELIATKMNPSANIFLPGMPSHDEETSQRWMAAMDYIFRQSMRTYFEPQFDMTQNFLTVDPLIHHTVMIRNIPNKFTRDKLLKKLQDALPKNCIDFFYMPIDFANKCNVGYCFVNFRTSEGITKCVEIYHKIESRLCLPGFNSSKVVVVTPARVQGLQENVAHLETSSVFETLKERGLMDWAPMLFDEHGTEVPFPHMANDVNIARKSLTSSKKRKSASSDGSEIPSAAAFQDASSLLYAQVLPFVNPSEGSYTSIMIRNLPFKLTRNKFIDLLGSFGFIKDINFVYLPVDTKIKQNIGYAFVNMKTTIALTQLITQFNNSKPKGLSGSKPLEITPARVQGLDANITHLRNAEVLRDLNDLEDWLPVIIQDDGTVKPLMKQDLPKVNLCANAPPFLPRAQFVS